MLGREPIAPEGGVLVEIQTQDPVQEPDAGRRNARQVGGGVILLLCFTIFVFRYVYATCSNTPSNTL